MDWPQSVYLWNSRKYHLLPPGTCWSWISQINSRCWQQKIDALFLGIVHLWLDEAFCVWVDRRRTLSLISSRDNCQRFSPSQMPDIPRAGFEPMLNLNSEWSCAVVITITPWCRSDVSVGSVNAAHKCFVVFDLLLRRGLRHLFLIFLCRSAVRQLDIPK